VLYSAYQGIDQSDNLGRGVRIFGYKMTAIMYDRGSICRAEANQQLALLVERISLSSDMQYGDVNPQRRRARIIQLEYEEIMLLLAANVSTRLMFASHYTLRRKRRVSIKGKAGAKEDAQTKQWRGGWLILLVPENHRCGKCGTLREANHPIKRAVLSHGFQDQGVGFVQLFGVWGSVIAKIRTPGP
jgi:hypothetical protein